MAAVLVVVTNCDRIGDLDKKTGWYLPEVAHPYHMFKNAGCEMLFVSPKGGLAPLDPSSEESFKDDPICKEFLANKEIMKKLENTTAIGSVDASKFDAIFCSGGYGPMFDLPDCEPLHKAVATIYEKGGIVSAVCHGPAGLVNVKLSSGDYLVKGKTVTCFTNEEEAAVQLVEKEQMPFILENRCKENGANFQCAPMFQACVHASDRVVTGQNSASTRPMVEKVIELLKN